jgi:flagellar basal body-associated protein FliL
MANEPRNTEIDSADDLFLVDDDGEEKAPAPAAPTGTEQDTAELGDAEDEPPPEPAAEEPPPSPVDEDQEEDEGAPPAKKRRKTGPSVLHYYAIPAVGVVLIMSLGWTLAFLARRGLKPPAEPVKTAKAEKKRVLPEPKLVKKPKRDLRTVRLPQRETKEGSLKGREGTFIVRIDEPAPKKPASPPKQLRAASLDPPEEPPRRKLRAASLSPLKPVDTGETLVVPVRHPFFIPLRGDGRRRGASSTVFLNFSVNLLVSSKAAASEFNTKRAPIREMIYLHYARLSPSDLSTPGRRARARRRLVAKLDRRIVQGKVRGILFQEFYTR